MDNTEFFRNQIINLVNEKHELLKALSESTKVIQEAVDYYESTGIIDNVSDRIKKIALNGHTLILKYKAA